MQGYASPLRVFVAVVVALVLGIAREARAEDAQRTVDLYTMGPSNELPSRFGHSLLCVREAGHDDPEHGRCYDYGVPSKEDLTATVWEAVRETPSFIPVAIEEVVVFKFFKDQGRQIERQRLPISPAEVDKLVSSIEAEIRDRRAYAYHPYWANCATKIRDHIDDATGGRLRSGPSEIPPGTFREYMEEGHSGHLDFLTAMALFVGEGNDRRPTSWEAMMLPFILRDGVAERFSVPPEKLEERLAVVLPTSRAIGRVAVFLVAFLLFVAARVAARRNKLRVGLAIVGGTLGAIAIAIELTSAFVKWPEISHNWALALLLPTDLALPWLTSKRLALYLKARLAMAGLFVVLEIVGVVQQPMLHLVVLVALPLGGLLSALKARSPADAPAAASAPASTSSS
ncbi:MAG: DUF4105 domain-containing protein [Labilithrix sp.]|nr:DUF4105 domain-containing protein [Labilithrix sp.]